MHACSHSTSVGRAVTNVLRGASQMGLCSGIMGGMTAGGAVVGLVCLGFLIPVRMAYPLYALALVVSTPLTWAAARDKPQEGTGQRPFDWGEVAKAYYISPASHGDFFWVFVSRTFYYMAVSVQIYILYYLRDIIGIENAKAYTAILCILSQASSGIVRCSPSPRARPCSHRCDSLCLPLYPSCQPEHPPPPHVVSVPMLTRVQRVAKRLIDASAHARVLGCSLGAAPIADRTGRKPAIYMAVTIMAFVYIGYCFVNTYEWVVMLGVLYGAGNGVYIAVDYALAVDCLPSQVPLPPSSIVPDHCRMSRVTASVSSRRSTGGGRRQGSRSVGSVCVSGNHVRAVPGGASSRLAGAHTWQRPLRLRGLRRFDGLWR